MITAHMAYLPERHKMFRYSVNSIINQVDGIYINVGLNNKGDCEKFKYTSFEKGFIFTIDDDLYYPPDYVKTMIDHVERYERKAIITLHGRTFPPRPIKSYYRGRLKGYHWNTKQDEDIKIDAGGTGVMCWHSDTFKVPYNEITHGNMGDVWVSVFARRQNVPIICVKHSEDWLKYIGPDEDLKNPKTIYSKHINNDPIQTMIYNEG